MADNPDDRLYFRQLLSGRDFAAADPLAQHMVNFVYAIGDRASGECPRVAPAYPFDEGIDPGDTVGVVVKACLAPHDHPDPVREGSGG